MEFNRQTNEFGHAPPESTKPIEQMAFAPPPQPSEASKGAEYAPEPSAKQRPKPRRQRLSVSLLSALCAVVVGVGISSPMRQAFSPIDSAQVELAEFETGPNGITLPIGARRCKTVKTRAALKI